MIETALGGFGGMPTGQAGVTGETGGAFERAYVCRGTDFVESIASHLLDSGMDYNEIRTERFGP